MSSASLYAALLDVSIQAMTTKQWYKANELKRLRGIDVVWKLNDRYYMEEQTRSQPYWWNLQAVNLGLTKQTLRQCKL